MIILSYPKLRFMTLNWFEMAWLPNEAGFKFVGLNEAGLQIVCEVEKVDGLHKIKSHKITEFISWRNLTPDDLQAIKSM